MYMKEHRFGIGLPLKPISVCRSTDRANGVAEYLASRKQIARMGGQLDEESVV